MAATLDEVMDDLVDNADFKEVDSLAKARAFVTAAKRFFILSPQMQSNQGSSLSMNSSQIQSLMNEAQLFADAKEAASNPYKSQVRHWSYAEGFR